MKMTSRIMAVAWTGTMLLACGTPRQADNAAVPVVAPVDSAESLYVQGRVAHGARQPQQARSAYQDALRRDPAHRGAANGLAVLQAEEGDVAGAIARWRALLATQPAPAGTERAFLLGNLGYALFLQGARAEAVAVLEQACVLDPSQSLAWEHLGAVLETAGQTERAVRMMKQARALREHDLRQDATVAGAAVALPPPAALVPSPSLWPADLARTEVRSVGAAVVEVHRIVAAPARQPGATTSGLRLEISNGNGVRGMAAAWARDARIGAMQWEAVRLTNTRPFGVRVTRIEYGADGAAVAQVLSARLGLPAPRSSPGAGTADLRIVLGHDRRKPAAP
ncbi:LytR C-terminal domain-containing protein [Pseudoduganella chitinolytica]|uniref:Tetratricopeptide repeat protein n=1 Tax=Pseudoduganella chitinolytica TaxID=34070 RepID=A0ABY8B8R9_9BURK|nr:LytR C-terminal domain-containing protein [Pseudoduganella chitinolytica]WEF32324.1 tetratricopeptide repeat protein [Pseudoduganella chitinolytica]